MATEKFTTQGITEVGKRLAGAASSGITRIVALNGAAPDTANVAAVYNNPTGAPTYHSDEGLAEVAIDTVAPITAGVDYNHKFTATASRDVVGVHIINAESDVCFIEDYFDAKIAMEATDTLDIDGTLAIADA